MTRPNNREVRAYRNTLYLFERYWVYGETMEQIADESGSGQPSVNDSLAGRGIPSRTATDANRYRRGDVTLERLRKKYLTPFQRSLALELDVHREDALAAEVES